MKHHSPFPFSILALLLAVTLASCDETTTPPVEPATDATLLLEGLKTDSTFWYLDNPSILASSAATEHTAFFRVRFNERAKAALGTDGKLPAGAVFPEGSLVVKELYRSQTGALELIAVMKKATTDPQQKEGWLWAEYYVDGRVLIPVAGKGAACVACHSVNDRDYVRLFDLF